MTVQRSLIIGLCVAVLLLSLYTTSRYQVRSIRESLASSWQNGVSSQRTDNTSTSLRIASKRSAEFHLNNESLLAKKSPRPTFPRWNDTGIDIGLILDFIFHSSQYAVPPKERRHNSSYTPTNDHATDVGYWFPELLYILDADGLWCSQRHRDIIHLGKGTVKDKLEPTERLAVMAWQILKRTSDRRWPRLSEALTEGVPFLVYYGDFTGCNNWNYGSNASIPLFTTAAAVDCQYAIPFPNYQTIVDAKESSGTWDEAFRHAHERYPWHSKVPKVVWRGSLTGNVLNATHKSTRWTVLEEVHQRSSSMLFDVQATRLPKRHEGLQLNLSAIGGIGEGFPNMGDFQNFKAILDMDGNSWSSRFGKLMCYNSVVLKMKPRYVDYFFFDLLPWIHYIPVADANDLMDKARYALDPNNEDKVRKIVLEANAWCRRRMVESQIVEDMLDIWEAYVKLLDAGSGGPQWQSTTWAPAKSLIRQAESPLAMKLLSNEVET